jgi:hypothetical protein
MAGMKAYKENESIYQQVVLFGFCDTNTAGRDGRAVNKISTF